jgi:hypothetical protein
MDVVYIAIGVAFFALTVGLVHAFERLRTPPDVTR